MRVYIIVNDDDGKTFEGEANLSARRQPKPAPMKKKSASGKTTNAPTTVNLSSPIPTLFVKKHAGGMGGAQRLFCLRTSQRAKPTKRFRRRLCKSNGAN